MEGASTQDTDDTDADLPPTADSSSPWFVLPPPSPSFWTTNEISCEPVFNRIIMQASVYTHTHKSSSVHIYSHFPHSETQSFADVAPICVVGVSV